MTTPVPATGTATRRERLEKLVADMQTAHDAIDEKRGRGVEPAGDELAAIVAMSKDAAKLKSEIVADAKSAADQRDTEGSIEDAKRFLHDLGINPDAQASGDPATAAPAGGSGRATIGERFVDSPQFKALMARFPGGRIPDRASLAMDSVGFRDLISGGALVSSDRTGIYDPGAFRRPLTMRDIVTGGQTDSDTVEYARAIAQTNAAAPVPTATTEAPVDGTTVTDATGGVKPQSAFQMEKVVETVRTIAHWTATTRRALADAAQLRSLIDGFLRYGLEEELEDQMVAGDGAGENFTGITNLSGVQLHAVGTDPLLDAYRKAKTKVRMGGRANATAYLMHPNDWENVDLLRNAQGDFYFGGPAADGGPPRLWRLPVVESEACPEGTAFVGDFRTLMLWDREQASVTISTEHADFFARNLVAILAEMRAAFGALRPAAICKITGV